MISIVVLVKGGKINNYQNLESALEVLNDGNHRIQIEEIKDRSLSQNKYYWKVMVPAVKEGLRDVGWDEIKTDDDAHEYIKDEFLKRELKNHETGKTKVIPGSTSRLSTKEFGELIEAVIKWAVEFLGVQIPFPNERI